jgi:hypothetical protein
MPHAFLMLEVNATPQLQLCAAQQGALLEQCQCSDHRAQLFLGWHHNEFAEPTRQLLCQRRYSALMVSLSSCHSQNSRSCPNRKLVTSSYDKSFAGKLSWMIYLLSHARNFTRTWSFTTWSKKDSTLHNLAHTFTPLHLALKNGKQHRIVYVMSAN